MSSSLAEKFNKDYFAKRFFGMDFRRNKSYLQEYKRICRHVLGGCVLDVGCGMGNFLDVFDNGFWDKYGIEISEYAAGIAAKKGIKLIDYDFNSEFFDLVVFRGVFQYFEDPWHPIGECARMLKPGGIMAFLATPNANSICYRVFGDLPMLEKDLNFIIPSDNMLKKMLTDLKLEVLEFRYPYLDSPYANILLDHLRFFLKFFGIKRKFAFWGNMMECYARRPV